jgi:hypothetical protein
MDMSSAIRIQSRAMVAFDALLATGALLAPTKTLQLLGHAEPSPDAAWLFRRCAPTWATFALAHLASVRRGDDRDWWALGWLRATEIATDAVWSASPAFARRRHRRLLAAAGVANLAMTLAYRAQANGARRR